MKECVICKRSFESNYSKKIFCSHECYKIGRRDCQHRYSLTLKGKKCFDNYMSKPKSKLRIKNYMKIYSQTDKFKRIHRICNKRYSQTDKFKQAQAAYKKTEEAKTLIKKWNRTLIGRAIHLRASRKRRAMKNNIIETFTLEEFNNRVSNVCPNCKNIYDEGIHKLTMDHTYPISKANEDYKQTGFKRIYNIDDVQPLCHSCNSSKGNKILQKPKDL